MAGCRMAIKGRPLAKQGYEQELSSIRAFVSMQNKADGTSSASASDHGVSYWQAERANPNGLNGEFYICSYVASVSMCPHTTRKLSRSCLFRLPKMHCIHLHVYTSILFYWMDVYLVDILNSCPSYHDIVGVLWSLTDCVCVLYVFRRNWSQRTWSDLAYWRRRSPRRCVCVCVCLHGLLCCSHCNTSSYLHLTVALSEYSFMFHLCFCRLWGKFWRHMRPC